jgi:DNA adenine methylase
MRYHGGKWKLAPWIIQHFAPHRVYVEPFGGAAGVLCRKSPSDAEVYNDLDGEIVNVFRVLRDPVTAARLADASRLTPYAREELDLANLPSEDPVEQARRTLFRAWASFGSAGATGGRSGLRTFTGSGRYASVTEAWCRVADSIAPVRDRFRHVLIENRPAIEVMVQHDSPETLHYVDPPYLPETRSFDGGRYYRHEMSKDDHAELLRVLNSLGGMVVLSAYGSGLYAEMLAGWTRFERDATACGRHGGVSRTECLYLNPAAAEGLRQGDLFSGGAA